jgi:translation initiation factor eIF-2B subunit epsilon
VFCCSHAEQIDEYIQNSKWGSSQNPGLHIFRCTFFPHAVTVVSIIAAKSVTSAGDALREIEGMGIIRSDPFVLVSGDVVSNMDLKSVVEQHKARRAEDKNNIMTVV